MIRASVRFAPAIFLWYGVTFAGAAAAVCAQSVVKIVPEPQAASATGIMVIVLDAPPAVGTVVTVDGLPVESNVFGSLIVAASPARVSGDSTVGVGPALIQVAVRTPEDRLGVVDEFLHDIIHEVLPGLVDARVVSAAGSRNLSGKLEDARQAWLHDEFQKTKTKLESILNYLDKRSESQFTFGAADVLHNLVIDVLRIVRTQEEDPNKITYDNFIASGVVTVGTAPPSLVNSYPAEN